MTTTDQLSDLDQRCLRALLPRPLEKNLVRVMLLGVEEPEKHLAELQERGLVDQDKSEWSLTAEGEKVIKAALAEKQAKLDAIPDQAGQVGYGRDLHLLRFSPRKDRGPDRRYYAACGADSPKRKTYPLRPIDPKKPLDEQISCQRCLRSAESKR